jgi:hypothetical protein
MEQDKHTLPVTAPPTTVEHHEHQQYDEKKQTDTSCIEQAYMFDKMTTVEEAEYNPNESANESTITTASKSKTSYYIQKYRKLIQ